MTNEQLNYFIQAYNANVANASETIVRNIISNTETAYENHKDDYTSVMDALGMFQAGIRYAEKIANRQKAFAFINDILHDVFESSHFCAETKLSLQEHIQNIEELK
jgi:hypothetical protein